MSILEDIWHEHEEPCLMNLYWRSLVVGLWLSLNQEIAFLWKTFL